jgi:hypothetical protein
MDGNLRYNKRRVRLSGKDKYRYPKGSKAIPYGLDRLIDAQKIRALVIVEGESDCWTLWKHNVPALGVPGASAYRVITEEHISGLDKIFIIQEPGEAGTNFSMSLAPRIKEFGFEGQIRIIRMTEEAKDPNEFYLQNPPQFHKRFVDLCKRAMHWGGESIEDMIISLESVEAGQIDFLWHPYIPRGVLTTLAGPGGLGKSTLAYALTTSLSVGAVLPETNEYCNPCDILLFSDEDDLENVLVPKLTQSGADLSRIKAFDLNEFDFAFTPSNMTRLEMMLDVYDPAVVIFDPLVSFTGGKVNMNQGNEMRSILGPLAAIARKRNIAIIIIAHTRKGGDAMSMQENVAGSADIVNGSRSCLMIAEDPEDSKSRILVHAKHNYSSAGKSLTFEIDEDGQFYWTGTSHMSASDVSAQMVNTSEKAVIDSAVEFLIQELDTGARDIEELMTKSRKIGISASAMKKAELRLGVMKTKIMGNWCMSKRLSSVEATPQQAEVIDFPAIDEMPY